MALENLDGGFLTLQHDGGDLKIKPLDARRSDLHGVTSSKMEQSMFTVGAAARPHAVPLSNDTASIAAAAAAGPPVTADR